MTHYLLMSRGESPVPFGRSIGGLWEVSGGSGDRPEKFRVVTRPGTIQGGKKGAP